jgi:hypothetical protein
MEGGNGILNTYDKDFLFLPARLVVDQQNRYDREKERTARNRVRYERKHPERRKHHGPIHRAIDKEFICWDGEGPKDTDYSLFGNSKGMEICHPGPLETGECLNLIIATEQAFPDCIHIVFGGNYDITQILKRGLARRKFMQLIKSGYCSWEGFRIRHVPGKWFDVKHGQVTARIFDIRSFFEGGLVSVLTEWKIGPFGSLGDGKEDVTSFQKETVRDGQPLGRLVIPSVSELARMSEAEIVRTFKDLRSDFTWADIESIRVYMRLELKYTIELMNRVRDTLYQAGYLPASWHGPGAIATLALRRHGVYKAMAECPKEVREAARYGFSGGRFEDVLGGWARSPVWIYDLSSAYPYFATLLPNLARGTWRYTTGKFEPGKFAIYHIRYDDTRMFTEASQEELFRIHPLFKRMPDGGVHFPPRVEGWYWNPEAELVADSDYAEFKEAWVFDEEDETDRPFAWLNTYYERKESAKRRNDRTGWVWKKIINAVFGQLARKSGWNRKSRSAPRSHQLEWAGWITSATRARVYNLAQRAGRYLVSIDTDGITTLAPIRDLDTRGGLGGWTMKRYEDIIAWQSGIYFLMKDGKWTKGEAKTRGIPKGTYTAEDLIAKLEEIPENHEDRYLELTKRLFITYRTAQIRGWEKLGTWEDLPCKFIFGGHDKRAHQKTSICREHCSQFGNMHRFVRAPGLAIAASGKLGMWSIPHKLPWLDEPENDELVQEDEYLIRLGDRIDDDMVWVRTLV